ILPLLFRFPITAKCAALAPPSVSVKTHYLTSSISEINCPLPHSLPAIYRIRVFYNWFSHNCKMCCTCTSICFGTSIITPICFGSMTFFYNYRQYITLQGIHCCYKYRIRKHVVKSDAVVSAFTSLSACGTFVKPVGGVSGHLARSLQAVKCIKLKSIHNALLRKKSTFNKQHNALCRGVVSTHQWSRTPREYWSIVDTGQWPPVDPPRIVDTGDPPQTGPPLGRLFLEVDTQVTSSSQFVKLNKVIKCNHKTRSRLKPKYLRAEDGTRFQKNFDEVESGSLNPQYLQFQILLARYSGVKSSDWFSLYPSYNLNFTQNFKKKYR
ncbi:hypothetical protein L9F63_010211, partial [Diploptera punctata]